MKTKLYSAIVGATLLAASGLAMAETPLTTSQMDGVTAGGIATATALAAAAGGFLAATVTETETVVQGLVLVPAVKVVQMDDGAIYTIELQGLQK